MLLNRIYTENKNLDAILKITSTYFEGFTLIRSEGYWKGSWESSLILEIVTESKPEEQKKIDRLAAAIKAYNKQESVLVTQNPVIFKLV